MMQTQDTMPSWFPVFFPVFFVFMWLSITTLLALFSGWFQLRRQFPITGDTPLLKLRMQSGMMGWVNFSGILSFAACQSGLRIGVWRLFGPFSSPFQVPWDQIEAEPVTRFLMPMVRLGLGRPAIRKLTINARTWERLKAASQNIAPPRATETTRRVARAFLIQWAAATCLVGSFFYLAPRLAGAATEPTAQIPLIACFGFPAIVFGAGTLIRFLFATR